MVLLLILVIFQIHVIIKASSFTAIEKNIMKSQQIVYISLCMN